LTLPVEASESAHPKGNEVTIPAAAKQDARQIGEGMIFPALVENQQALGQILLVCEHAANHFPDAWGNLGLSAAERQAHIAYDPGALELARGLSRHLDAVLVHAQVSRLIYDLNRAPDQPGAMPARSEIHDVPGNQHISADQRAARTAAIYAPFHAGLHGVIADRIARGVSPVIITIHSFTPLYFGKPRTVEFGVIHDADPTLALAICDAARSLPLQTELNAPYSAADGVTHTLRLHATPYGLPNAMLEIRNDLIDTRAKAHAMAAMLAPVLNMGLVEIQRQAKAS
jgi:predicted N-formylglutamate amidohydrolase